MSNMRSVCGEDINDTRDMKELPHLVLRIPMIHDIEEPVVEEGLPYFNR